MKRCPCLLLLLLLASAALTYAQGEGGAPVDVLLPSERYALDERIAPKFLLDTVWVIMAAVLVYLMQAGFAYLEAGLVRAKNAVSILMKNLMDLSVGALAFFTLGFALMFGDGNPFFGQHGFFLLGADNSPLVGDLYEGVFTSLSWAGVPLEAKFVFHLAFAATAATIVSGAMAERTKFSSYLIYSAVITGVIYPVAGHWIWGGGWLYERGFRDFAGSTVVHGVGGWLALMGAYIVGPRAGKYDAQGQPKAIPGHSLPMATLGVFLLWVGWFGFNAGSTMAAQPLIALICLNTILASAASAVTTLFTARILFKEFDISLTLNGILAGLVAITAGCGYVQPAAALAIGALAGPLIVFSIIGIDNFGVDDPVGAISVHAICGVYGTLMVGLFAQSSVNPDIMDGLFFGGGFTLLGIQALGATAVFLFCAITGLLLFATLKGTMGLRIPAEEEEEGMDVSEHGIAAYPDPGFFGMNDDEDEEEELPTLV
ncbi:MAG: ammonium transporter [Sumerlaeia bacterium]